MPSTSGILIRRLVYGNSSLIVSWMTADHGFIKTMAKGASTPKSPFAGQMDLYYQCDLSFVPARRGDIHTLTEVVVRKPHLGLRTELVRIEGARYFVELLDALTEPETHIPEFHDLLEKALSYLEKKTMTQALLFRFEKKALEISGLGGSQLPREIHGHHFRVPASRGALLEKLRT